MTERWVAQVGLRMEGGYVDKGIIVAEDLEDVLSGCERILGPLVAAGVPGFAEIKREQWT